MALLVAAAQRDDAGAVVALDAMRTSMRVDTVANAITLAAEVLGAQPSLDGEKRSA